MPIDLLDYWSIANGILTSGPPVLHDIFLRDFYVSPNIHRALCMWRQTRPLEYLPLQFRTSIHIRSNGEMLALGASRIRTIGSFVSGASPQRIRYCDPILLGLLRGQPCK